jgi:dienelactone hydrolase
MIVDLIRTRTTDDLRLDGALQVPPAETSKCLGIDAFICLHGVGSNFYSFSLAEQITPHLLDLGIAVLWANTRGHDGLYTAIAAGQRRRQGAAYEIVDQCRHDIAAWVNFLTDRGYRRVGLFGHSLGAIKAIYYAAHQEHPKVHAIIAASPARLSCQSFQSSDQSPRFRAAMETAELYIREGQPDALLEAEFPFPLVIAAGAYVDKYGPGDRYDILKFADQVPCPTLFTFGSVELESGGVAFAGLPELLAALPPQQHPLDIVTIQKADHLYTGAHQALAEKVVEFVRRVSLGRLIL